MDNHRTVLQFFAMHRAMLAICAGWVCSGAAAEPREAAVEPRVHVESGELIGVAHDDVVAFKGIPYAAPPVGDLRWRAPQRVKPWSAPRSAADYGYSCAQPEPPKRVSPDSVGARTSEDCLTLNVWSPVRRAKPLPVMVWIHGGGNISGTSAQTYYDGTSYARDGVVLVSFNYRLGAFGFLIHPALTQDAKNQPAANYGLLDQIAALEWVQRNVAAFGGDPKNVTVWGESAGGSDIVLLMTAHASAGLFHRAIIESPGFWNALPEQAALEKRGAEAATALGLPGATATAAELRALPADALARIKDFDELGPVLDHKLLNEFPMSAFTKGHVLRIPMIIGTNSHEGSLLPPDAVATNVVPDLTQADLATVSSYYGEIATQENTLAGSLFRDAFFAMPARWLAGRDSASAPAYLYRFDYIASFLRSRRTGADHGSEIPFVFATWPERLLSDADRNVTVTLHGCWVAFARTGVPTCPNAPVWPAYHVQQDAAMLFGETATVGLPGNAAALNFLQAHLMGGAH